MMGPGCGTSIINGAALGFANVVERGPIGVIAAAGTGVQEVTTLIHQAGSGISHAIGTGGRDLYDDIGGIMMSKGVQMLEKDTETKVIVLISKPPGPKTQKTILETNFSKPVVVCFMGGDLSDLKDTNVLPTETLEDAAMAAVALVKNEVPKTVIFSNSNEVLDIAKQEWSKLKAEQKYVRGLYSGGTVCSECIIILSKFLNVYSNTTKSEFKLPDIKNSK